MSDASDASDVSQDAPSSRPRRGPGDRPATAATPLYGPATPAPRVLVVDDAPESVLIAQALLEGEGYEVATAADGHAGLEQVARRPPDLILLDVMMPGLDGFEVTRRLKEDAATRVIPVVLLTALDAIEDRVAGIEAGADDFITKPFNRHELTARVRSLLRVKRYHDQLAAQRAQLAELNRTLDARVRQQMEEINLLSRLLHLLSQSAQAAPAGDAGAVAAAPPAARPAAAPAVAERDAAVGALRRSSVFAHLSERELAAVASLMWRVHRRKGELLLVQDEPASAAYVVVAGTVDAVLEWEDGRSLQLARHGPGDLVGETSLLTGEPSAAMVVAATDVELLALPREPFMAELSQQPRLMLRLLVALTQRLRLATQQLGLVAFAETEVRLATLLLARAQPYAHGLAVETTQDELAQMVGTTRPTVGRIFIDWRQRGYVRTERQRTVIVDPDALRALAATSA